MALSNDEILRCKRECGYNVVGVGAEAYSSLDGYVAVFDRAIQPYLIDQGTTSTTLVTAASTGASVALTLALNPSVAGNGVQATTFATGSNIVVDVGPAQETTVIQNLTGLVAIVQLFNAHGTLAAYPVQPRGAEWAVRDIFARLDKINSELSGVAPLTAGLEALVGEVQFSPASKGRNTTRNKADDLLWQRLQARRDLCLLLGIDYLPDRRKGGGGQRYEIY